jgi:hypothetical protein
MTQEVNLDPGDGRPGRGDEVKRGVVKCIP